MKHLPAQPTTVRPWPLSRRGVVFPFVVVMVVIMLVLGGIFLFSTVQSKNIFQVFYRSDLARLIAESAVAEWQAFFQEHISADADLQALLANPTGRSLKPVTIKPAMIPETLDMADNLLGRGNYRLDAKITVRHCDNVLEERVGTTSKFSAFRGEYQAALLIEFHVLMTRGSDSQEATFWFEYDLKRVCLRSNPNTRGGGGYTGNSTNDYVLFLRNAYDEFDVMARTSPPVNGAHGRLRVSSLNATDFPVTFRQRNGKGKFFFGAVPADAPDTREKYVFLNVAEGMEFLLPPQPQPINIPWSELEQFMPSLTRDLRNALSRARIPEAVLQQIRAQLLREYRPLVGTPAWERGLSPREQELRGNYWAKVGSVGPPMQANDQLPIQLSANDLRDPTIFGAIEGNLRKRFWQTVLFKLDLSQIDLAGLGLDAAQIQAFQAELRAREEKFRKGVFYLHDLDRSSVRNDVERFDKATREMFRLVFHHEQQEDMPLLSQAIDLFAYAPGQQQEKRPGAKPVQPHLFGRTRRRLTAPGSGYLPFTPFLLRSYRFPDAAALHDSFFFDPTKKCLHLNGIFLVEDRRGGCEIIDGATYAGKGVILSYGNIRVQGSFQPANPQAGPCVLYTYADNIYLNVKSPGPVRASLIALNFRFSPNDRSSWSGIHFGGKRADVLGNVVADHLNLGSMFQQTGNPNVPGVGNTPNRIDYDDALLSGPDLYHTMLGGRLRGMHCAYRDGS